MADINEIISPAAIKGIQRTTEELEKANLEIEKAIVNSKKLSDNMASIKSMQDLNTATQKLAIEQEKLRKAIAAAQLQEERLSAFRENEIKKEEARQERLRKAREKTNKNATGPTDFNPYKELEEQYKAAAMRAQNLGAQLAKLQNLFGSSPSAAEAARLKTLAKSFDEAAKEAADLQQQLAGIDAKVGKYGRNVGNYKSGFNGLQNSIDQLTRELPAFTYSFQTGFMAISNNLPIFFDQIKMTREQIKAMREEGKQVPGLLKQIATSFFSWGTALSIGVTLLTVYGKEIGNFIIALFKGAKAIDYFAESQKMMQEVRRKGFQDAQTEIVNLSNLYRAAQNTSLAYNERKKAVDELQKQYPAVLGNLKDEDILAGKVGKSYQFLTQQILARSFASAASTKISDNMLREYDNEEKRIKARIELKNNELKLEELTIKARSQGTNAGSTVVGASDLSIYGRISNVQAKIRENNKIIRESNVDSAELNKRNLKLIGEIDKAVSKYGVTVIGVNEDIKKDKEGKDLQKIARDNAVAAIDAQIEIEKKNREIFDKRLLDEQLSYSDRIDARNGFYNTSITIAELEAKKERKLQELTDREIKDGKKISNEEKLAVDIDFSKKVELLNIDLGQKTTSIYKYYLSEQERLREEANQRQLNSISKNRDNELALVTEAFTKRGIFTKKSQEDFEKKRLEIVRKYAKQEILVMIDQAQKLIDIKKAAGLDTSKDEAELAALKLKNRELDFNNEKDTTEKELKNREEKIEKIKELSLELLDFSKSITESIFSGNIQSIEKEKKADEDRKNRQIENINESLLSEEQKQEQIAIIESQSEERQRQLDARIAAQKRKQAIADKAFALSQVAINTAIAVAKVWGQTGIFGLAAQVPVLAMGALQAAAILAQPIPEFRHGGTMDKDGIAKFGEVGRELRINPDGSTELTPSSTTLGFVEAGTKFIDAAETRRLMAKPTKVDIAGKSWEVGAMLNEQRKSTDRIEKAVKGININTMVLTKNGIRNEKMRQDRLNKWFRRNF